MTTTTLLWLLLGLGLASTPAAAFLLGHERIIPQAPPPRRPSSLLKTSATTTASDAAFPSSPSLFVFGLGYVGQRIARELTGRGWRVHGTSTSTRANIEPPGATPIESFAFDPTAGQELDPGGLAALRGATHLLVTIPPLGGEEKEDAVLACYGAELRAHCPSLRWIGYLSSTSVYGDRGGGWASEDGELTPVSPQGKARVRAEEGWRGLVEGGSWGAGRPQHPPRLAVFRLAGIYGPGRSALDTLRRAQGEQGPKLQGGPPPLRFPVDGERLVSRVHVDDIVRVVRCAMEQEAEGEGEQAGGVRVYNVADDRPASRLEVFSHAACLLASSSRAARGAGVVTVVAAVEEEKGSEAVGSAATTTRTRSRRPPESKQVDNRRMKEELLARCFAGTEEEEDGGLLLYKDYVAGLDAIWQEVDG